MNLKGFLIEVSWGHGKNDFFERLSPGRQLFKIFPTGKQYYYYIWYSKFSMLPCIYKQYFHFLKVDNSYVSP